MPYTINRYNGAQIAVVADGTIDNTTDLKLIGKNYAGYGEVQNENFLFLLENFANTNPPPRPLSGQIWYDSSSNKLKFYDGVKFRTTGGAEIGTTAPTGLTVGDFWFDTANNQLYAYNGNLQDPFTLIGPQGIAGAGVTQMRSRTVKAANSSNTYPIIEGVVNDETVFIISPSSNPTSFLLDTDINPIPGFNSQGIQQGLTLCYTPGPGQAGAGITTSSHRYWGTASNSLKLNGKTDADFISSIDAQFNTLVRFSDLGFTVGDVPKLRVFNTSSTTPTIQNQLNDTILFLTKVNGNDAYPLTLKGADLLPGGPAPNYYSDNVNNIGSASAKFNTVHANIFSGTATRADSLNVGGTYRTASTAASPSTIVVRTTNDESIGGINVTAGAIKATYFVGTATSANYADLAEKYLADAEYEVGTVVAVGGEKEVTACSVGQRALGAVSGKPAYLMNFELENGTPIALKGRVPVKVTGPVRKGQRLVAGENGTAVGANSAHMDVFAIALEDNQEAGVKLVECVIL